MRLFANANYDFLGRRNTAYLLTLAIILPGLIALLVRGVNYSVEFTGGTLMQVETRQPVDVGAVRNALSVQGVEGAELQTFGSDRELVIRARQAKEGTDQNDTQATAGALQKALDSVLGAGNYTVVRTEAVGPKVGGELREKAILAILFSFVAVLVYLAYRFEWRFGVAAIIATAHDIIASIAFISIARLEVSLFVVAGLMTIIGYSLNDTIVIFDRIRENLHLRKRDHFIDILNRSINETLPRTVFTGTTALGSLLALAVLGGEVVRPFALLMLFGVIVGTFSSIFIASPALLEIEKRWPGPAARGHLGAKPPASPAPRKPQPVASGGGTAGHRGR
ncbi:MAG TPA: protein translocase subunit SecF [Gemmatimonadales bacterium]